MKTFPKHIFLLFVFALSSNSYPAEFYLKSHNFYDSEAVPFHNFETDWASHYRPGEIGITYQWHEAGMRFVRWGFGLFQKKQTFLKFHEETALAVHTIGAKLPMKNADYRMELNAKYYNLYGLRLFGTVIQNNNLKLSLGTSLIYGEELTDGKLKGDLTALSDKDYEFNDIRLDYFYSEDKRFEHDAKRPTGEGYSFDLELQWQAKDEISIQFIARDLFGEVNWSQAPKTVALVESDNKTVDENGYTKVDPTLSGNQRTENFTQHLAPYLFVKGLFGDVKTGTFSLQMEHYYLKAYQTVGWGRTIPFNLFLELLYEVQTRAAGFSLQHKYGAIRFVSDHYDQTRSHTLNFSASVNIYF